MSWWEAFRTARRALRANKLRSFLTMLGIIVGVASLITMVAVGSGAETQIAEQIRSLGGNVLMVEPGAATQGGIRVHDGRRRAPTEADSRAIANEIPGVAFAAPTLRGRFQLVRGNRNWFTAVYGTISDYFVIREWPLAAGRYFAPNEETGAANVALVGTVVAEELFGRIDAVGQEFRIANVSFRVIGVLAEKGVSGAGQRQDDAVFVPLSTIRLRLLGRADDARPGAVHYILARAVSEQAMQEAIGQIHALLRQRHSLDQEEAGDFIVSDPAALMAARTASTTTFAWLIAAIGSVSLLVGGISIMNIMLVSVSERTREIGIRLAVGARRSDIRNQFLTEAFLLCLLGGMLGLLLGVGASVAVARLADWPILLLPEAAIIAVGFASLVGLFFGFYPARKAARLHPVEALRSE